MSDKKRMVIVENTYEAIKIVVNNIDPEIKMENVVFIKMSDAREYVKNQKDFIIKSFGDRLSNYFINFIYKDGDKDLDAKKLESEIKTALLFKSLKK
jgi:hypothetical protein